MIPDDPTTGPAGRATGDSGGADREILFVADPMCSWCWGFAPVMAEIETLCAGRARVTPVMGGLRPLTPAPMTDADKTEIRHHWEQVHERTGQPFDFAFLERDGFTYDTEPACRAVVMARRLDPGRAGAYLEALHRAFYAGNRDVTDADVLADVAAETGYDRAAFADAFASRAAFYETAGDFHAAQRLGVTGYPTVILRKGRALALLTAGFQPFEDLRPALDAWLAD